MRHRVKPLCAALLLLAGILSGWRLEGARGVAQRPDRARNVILFVGDGFGASQVAFGIHYAREIEGRELNVESIMKRGNTGYTMPVPHGSVVIDSAAAAAQIASGLAVRNETIGLDPDGNEVQTILEWAEKLGLATGLITNMRLTHATPAAFASHQISRYQNEPDFADDMLAEHEVEVLLGGGARAMIPEGKRASASLPGIALDGPSIRKDDRNLLDESRARGYTLVGSRSALGEAAARAGKLLGLFSADHLPYVLDRKREGLAEVPTLVEMTDAALSVLSRNENGFFVMIEGGRIDYAGHDNDAGTLLAEILEFDEAIGAGLRFQEKNPETLLIVTADHGTGGFSLTYSRRPEPLELALDSGRTYRPRWDYAGVDQLRILGRQKSSYESMLEKAGLDVAKLREVVREETGLELTWPEASRVVARNERGHAEPCDFKEFYSDYESAPQALLGRALARQTYAVWSTGGHTTDPVLTFGVGPGAEELRGVHLNTKIYEVMKGALSHQ